MKTELDLEERLAVATARKANEESAEFKIRYDVKTGKHTYLIDDQQVAARAGEKPEYFSEEFKAKATSISGKIELDDEEKVLVGAIRYAKEKDGKYMAIKTKEEPENKIHLNIWKDDKIIWADYGLYSKEMFFSHKEDKQFLKGFEDMMKARPYDLRVLPYS